MIDAPLTEVLDDMDRRILNRCQEGFPVTERPFLQLAGPLGLTEDALLARIRRMVDEGLLSRFGAIFHPKKLGGTSTLVAMRVPEDRLEDVIRTVNAHPEVSHNYEREHALNVWYVVSVERPEDIEPLLQEIERETDLRTYNLPMLEEYFVGVKFRFPE